MADDDDDKIVEILPPTPRKRGRKAGLEPAPELIDAKPEGGDAPGAKKPGTRRSKADQIADMAEEIQGAHEFAAAIFGMEFLKIDERQALRLATPAHAVAKKWGFDGFMSPELKLALVAGAVYGPMAAELRRELLRRQADAAKPANPSPSPPPGANGAAAPPPQPDWPDGRQSLDDIVAAGADTTLQ